MRQHHRPAGLARQTRTELAHPVRERAKRPTAGPCLRFRHFLRQGRAVLAVRLQRQTRSSPGGRASRAAVGPHALAAHPSDDGLKEGRLLGDDAPGRAGALAGEHFGAQAEVDLRQHGVAFLAGRGVQELLQGRGWGPCGSGKARGAG